MANYRISTNDYANGGVMVEVLPTGADSTLPNYGNVRAVNGVHARALYVWSTVSGRYGVELTQDAAIKAAARAIWRSRPAVRARIARRAKECACVMDCRDCSLSGEWHVHPGDACAVHPDAPGDH